MSPVSSCVDSKGPKRECPDYRTAGPNSCHFDGSHTTVWSVYCMNVTAATAARNYTSQQHCLDVADIGERQPGLGFHGDGRLRRVFDQSRRLRLHSSISDG